MHDFVHATVDFIKQHQEWVLPVMFLVSFGESFVGISLLFPGTTIMVLAGLLVQWPLNPHGELSIWPPMIGGILGAVSGDAISFWMGKRFGPLIEKRAFFVRRPYLLQTGYSFFDRFGVASVFVGRFFGPVRAVIPLVAGIMGMDWGPFWLANIGSALIWAPSLLLVGTAFRRLSFAMGARHEWVLLAGVGLALAFAASIWAVREFKVMDRVRGWLGSS